ncbi:MAG: hypothetical protein ABJE66_28210 [Deltaproteobacteria bacterium]
MICKTYLGLIGVMVTATGAWAGGKTVGTTKDSCDADNVVKFATKVGTAQVKNDQQEHRFEMLGMLREFHWYCAGSRERVANDEQFNVVVIRRAKNGAISWTFVLDNGASGGTSGQSGGQVGGTTETVTPPGLIRVGDSRDACDASHPVFVKDVSGLDVTIKANQLRFVELAHKTQALRWRCDKSNEWVRNHADFDHVLIERAGNGAINWVFFHDPASHETDDGLFVHNAGGVIRIAGLLSPDEVPAANEPDLNATVADALAKNRQTIEKAVAKDVIANGATAFPGAKITSFSLHLPDASSIEFRTAVDSQTLRFKAVLHDTTAKIGGTFSGINATLDATFDLDVIWSVPSNGKASDLKVQSTTMFAHHVNLVGDDVGSGLGVTFVKPTVREIGNTFTGLKLHTLLRGQNLQTITDLVDSTLAKLRAGAPASATATLSLDAAGSVKACVSLSGGTATCNFRADPAPPSARPTIGTSGDQCGQGSLWLWDAERATFVRIKKGEKAIHVEVENNRFEWYCGGDTSPDVTNQEWASGPLATRAVSVTRPTKNSPAITWKFESYK